MTLYTIGHSNQPLQNFLNLLKQYRIQVLVDVRSSPYSQYAPDFNQDKLRRALTDVQVSYLFMGDLLGGRPKDGHFYDKQGHVMYWLLAESPFFKEGITRLENGMKLRNGLSAKS